MKLEEGIISPLQLLLLTIGIILGIGLIPTITVPVAGHNNWLALLIATVEGVLVIYIFSLLSENFPNKTLIEINDLIYGQYLGKIISSLYILYLTSIISLNIRFFGDFFIALALPGTPLWVFIAFMIISANYAVKEGLEVIARCSLLLLLPMVLEILITPILLLPNMDFSHFLPMANIPMKNLFKAADILASILFGEYVIVLMMIAPFVNEKKKIKRMTILGVIIGGMILVLVALRNTNVLGHTEMIYIYPSYQTVRLIGIKDIITRVEIIIAASFLFAMFIKVSAVYYSTVLGTAQILKLRSYSPLVIPIGIIALTLSIIMFENFREQLDFGRRFYPILSFPFHIGIPLLSLLISKLKNRLGFNNE